jgi:hypothetical protein
MVQSFPTNGRKLRVLLTKTEIKNIAYSPLVFEDDHSAQADADDPIVASGAD